METRGIIEVGDSIEGSVGSRGIVDAIEMGDHGVLLRGTFTHQAPDQEPWPTFHAYVPNELPPSKRLEPWYGFAQRGTLTINGKATVGYVTFDDLWFVQGLPYCEAEWQRTLETIAEEEPEPMQSKPLPVAGNVARMD